VRVIELLARLASGDVVMQGCRMHASSLDIVAVVMQHYRLGEGGAQFAIDHGDLICIDLIVNLIRKCSVESGGLLAEKRARLLIAVDSHARDWAHGRGQWAIGRRSCGIGSQRKDRTILKAFSCL